MSDVSDEIYAPYAELRAKQQEIEIQFDKIFAETNLNKGNLAKIRELTKDLYKAFLDFKSNHKQLEELNAEGVFSQSSYFVNNNHEIIRDLFVQANKLIFNINPADPLYKSCALPIPDGEVYSSDDETDDPKSEIMKMSPANSSVNNLYEEDEELIFSLEKLLKKIQKVSSDSPTRENIKTSTVAKIREHLNKLIEETDKSNDLTYIDNQLLRLVKTTNAIRNLLPSEILNEAIKPHHWQFIQQAVNSVQQDADFETNRKRTKNCTNDEEDRYQRLQYEQVVTKNLPQFHSPDKIHQYGKFIKELRAWEDTFDLIDDATRAKLLYESGKNAKSKAAKSLSKFSTANRDANQLMKESLNFFYDNGRTVCLQYVEELVTAQIQSKGAEQLGDIYEIVTSATANFENSLIEILDIPGNIDDNYLKSELLNAILVYLTLRLMSEKNKKKYFLQNKFAARTMPRHSELLEWLKHTFSNIQATKTSDKLVSSPNAYTAKPNARKSITNVQKNSTKSDNQPERNKFQNDKAAKGQSKDGPKCACFLMAGLAKKCKNFLKMDPEERNAIFHDYTECGCMQDPTKTCVKCGKNTLFSLIMSKETQSRAQTLMCYQHQQALQEEGIIFPPEPLQS